MLEPAETANRLFQEIQDLQAKVEHLEYNLDFRGQGARTFEEIQLELKNLNTTR